ncbi:MAG: pilus assembly protein [Lachnospiraceae bacterium]|nr:pilus assembly protein [Lachnospiraceae bacterium]
MKDLNRASEAALKGSITIETALVLPLFLFAALTYMYIGEAIRFQGNLEEALHQSARELATYAYAYETGLNTSGGLLSGKVLSLTVASSMVKAHLTEEAPEGAPVEGSLGGVSFFRSSVLGGDEMVDLIASYKVDTPFDIFNIRNFTVLDRARIRAFTGYDNTGRQSGLDEEEEEIVYITEHGTVYHRDRSCSHLNFNIRTADESMLSSERNNSGGKYYPCEFCGGGSGGIHYITDDGDRYHSSLTCPALKRGIRAVPISKVGGRRPCRDCGY